MCAFQCDSCFHKRVCTDELNTRSINEECAQYANVKNFTDVQQRQQEIAAIADKLQAFNGCPDGGFNDIDDLIKRLRQLLA